jgi:hypothetical protein
MPKTIFVGLVLSLALFLPVRVVTHGQSYPVAWAQDATDSDDSADVSTEPTTAPPDIAGDWSGEIDDNNPEIGEHTFSIEVFQKKSKFKGDWVTGNGGSGTFKGKIKADGTSLSFKFKQKHTKCHFTSEGTLGLTAEPDVSGIQEPEITGTYKPSSTEKCEGVEGGTFQLIFEGVD